MRKPIKHTNEPIGRVKVLEDFLPPPGALVPRDETSKVAIAWSRRGVAFFRREARVHKRQDHRMIRALLDCYADVHESPRQ
jgi:hypothetical protein